jgi:hypothetical protein
MPLCAPIFSEEKPSKICGKKKKKKKHSPFSKQNLL